MPSNRMPSTQESAACVGETAFRSRVRDILDLSWATRDDEILAEVKRLKDQDGQRAEEGE
jgi:hypothetical protein